MCLSYKPFDQAPLLCKNPFERNNDARKANNI